MMPLISERRRVLLRQAPPQLPFLLTSIASSTLAQSTRVLAAGPRSIPRLVRFMAGMNKLHPAQPYWYLEVVGVDPGARGRGIGTRLLEPVLAQADEARQPCYLETMTERNVAWYRGLGFEVRSAGVSFVSGGPPNWTMLRPPRRLTAVS